MKKPVISVIVPVYNVENYLHECIDSILRQTYSDFELLLIDDGSLDKSGAICDNYADHDSRIHVFHKENRGVSSARNLGIKQAEGKWITFVDSDDMMAVNTLERCLSYAESSDVDFLQYSLTRERENLGKSFNNPLPCSLNEYIHKKLFMVGMGGSFIKRSIIHNHNIFFDESLKLAEDLVFIHTCLAYSKKCQRLYDLLYYYRDNSESSSNNRDSHDMELSCIAQHKLKVRFPLFSAAIDSSICQYVLSIIINNDFDQEVLLKLIESDLPYDKSLMRGTQLIFAYVAQINTSLAIRLVRWKFHIRNKHVNK